MAHRTAGELQFAILVLLLTGCPAGSGTPAKPVTARAGSAVTAGSVRTAGQFIEMTDRAGVQFTYRNGEEAGQFSILESVGGGAALFDYDGDGDVDLYLTGGGRFGTNREITGSPPAFYRNEGNWRFSLLTEPAGLHQAPVYTHGAVAGDYDNDGFPDLLVTGYGGLALHHNQGDGCFQETAISAGLTDKLWSSAAAWGDVDGDGVPDLYVVHYVDWSFAKNPVCPAQQEGKTRDVCSPAQFDPLPDILYLGKGDGTFRDASREAGLRRDGKGLGVVIADLDLDGDLDIYVANDDTGGNFFYRNRGGRGADEPLFEEFGLRSGTGFGDNGHPDGSMGVELGDFNLDGLPDLFVSNFERESFALYRNEGNGLFQHVSLATAISAVGGMYVGWGTAFFDFDRDGDEDIFVANGHVMQFPGYSPVRQNPLLFENDAGRRFTNVASVAGPYLQSPHRGRGVAVGDLDDDGDLDLVIAHTNEPAALLSNESANRHHWIGLRLIGTRSPRDPVGAVIRLQTARGVQTRQVKGGASFASSHDRRLFFGLNDAATIEQIEIRWPAGGTQLLHPADVDRVITVREPGTQAFP